MHNWPMILLGILLGLILVKDQLPFKLMWTRTSRHTTVGRSEVPARIIDPMPQPETRSLERWRQLRYGRDRFLDRGNLGRSAPQSPFMRRRSVRRRQTAKMLRERWRQSIVQLCKLSDSNLSLAERQLEAGYYKEAVEAVATSVENIARALLHCYGEKPEVSSGQEEVLRLLSRRFHDAEKEAFERAVNEVAFTHNNLWVLKHLSASNIETSMFDKEKAEQILKSASRVSKQFKQIMDNHFAAEIPELRDVCPECHSHNFNASRYGSGATTCQCNSCLHSWKLPPAQ